MVKLTILAKGGERFCASFWAGAGAELSGKARVQANYAPSKVIVPLLCRSATAGRGIDLLKSVAVIRV